MKNERGHASILVIGMTLIAVAVAGVAIDGTRAFLLRRSLQNSADAAALAAAGEIDRNSYYSSGGRDVKLDPEAAHAQAAHWIALRGISSEAAIAADQDAVHVVLRSEIGTTFLRVLGIHTVPVGAESTARPVPGDV